MKEAGLIIDFYRSPIEEESAFKKVFNDFFIPLIKIIKSHKEWSVTINIPLTTLDRLDQYGFSSFISDLKELYLNERLEISNTSPYGMSLTGISKEFSEAQIILNEYALGYYLGSRQGFEGEPAIMLKDLSGFVSHNNSMDVGLLNVLHDLDYKWVSVLSDTPDTTGSAIDKEGHGITTVPGLIFVKTYEDINNIVFPINAPLFLLEDADMKDSTYQGGTPGNVRGSVGNIMKKHQDSIDGYNVFKLHVPDVLFEKDLRNKLNQLATVLEEFDSLGITVHSVQEITKKIHREKIIKFESMSNNEISYSDENVTVGESDLQNINVVDSKKISKLKKEMGEIVSSVHIVKNIYDITPVTIWRPDVNREINDSTMSEYINIVNTFGLIGYLVETKKEIEEIERQSENNEYHEYTVQINNKIREILSLIKDDKIIKLIKELIQ